MCEKSDWLVNGRLYVEKRLRMILNVKQGVVKVD